MVLALKDLFRSKETAPEATEDSALNPELYFSAERAKDIGDSLRRTLSSISIGLVTHKNKESKKEKTSELKVEFDRDGKIYCAIFTLEREPSGSTYRMTAEIVSEHGKEIFKETITDRNALQVPAAITYVLVKAFNQNK